MNDVMDRLRAANPVTVDPATPPIEGLLAQLDSSPAPRRRRRRPRWVLVPIVAAALAAVVVAGELRGPSTDVIAEARAALATTDGIVHLQVLEERFNYDGTLVQGSGITIEIWSARNPVRLHVRQPSLHGGVDDAVYADGVFTARNTKSGKTQTTRLDAAQRREFENPDANVGLQSPGRDPIPVIRKLLADGELTHAGSTTVGARKVERLVGSIPADDQGSPREDVEYLVDAETFAPVRVATKGTLKDGRPAGHSRYTFKVYESLPLTAANEKLLAFQ